MFLNILMEFLNTIAEMCSSVGMHVLLLNLQNYCHKMCLLPFLNSVNVCNNVNMQFFYYNISSLEEQGKPRI